LFTLSVHNVGRVLPAAARPSPGDTVFYGSGPSDEPTTGNATTILTRRVKQGVSEWYVRDLLEKSRRGMEESVRQGWHTGGPVAYGYQLEPHPHPNLNKAREGKRKHRLIPEPIRAAVVLIIFTDYCVNLLGLSAICDRAPRDLRHGRGTRSTTSLTAPSSYQRSSVPTCSQKTNPDRRNNGAVGVFVYSGGTIRSR
jgi:hypothetical protein